MGAGQTVGKDIKKSSHSFYRKTIIYHKILTYLIYSVVIPSGISAGSIYFFFSQICTEMVYVLTKPEMFQLCGPINPEDTGSLAEPDVL